MERVGALERAPDPAFVENRQDPGGDELRDVPIEAGRGDIRQFGSRSVVVSDRPPRNA